MRTFLDSTMVKILKRLLRQERNLTKICIFQDAQGSEEKTSYNSTDLRIIEINSNTRDSRV